VHWWQIVGAFIFLVLGTMIGAVFVSCYEDERNTVFPRPEEEVKRVGKLIDKYALIVGGTFAVLYFLYTLK
jgi:hypothetical protein